MTETELVRACLELLKLRGVLCWRQNTGALPQIYRGKKRYIRFGVKGMSDIVGILPGGRIICVECKLPGGKLSEDQERFLRLVAQQGGLALVVRDLDELVRGLHGEIEAQSKAEG